MNRNSNPAAIAKADTKTLVRIWSHEQDREALIAMEEELHARGIGFTSKVRR